MSHVSWLQPTPYGASSKGSRGEGVREHCPPWGNYKLGLHSFCSFFCGESGLKTDQLTIQPVLLAQWEALSTKDHRLVGHAIQNYTNPPLCSHKNTCCSTLLNMRLTNEVTTEKDKTKGKVHLQGWCSWVHACLPVPGKQAECLWVKRAIKLDKHSYALSVWMPLGLLFLSTTSTFGLSKNSRTFLSSIKSSLA